MYLLKLIIPVIALLAVLPKTARAQELALSGHAMLGGAAGKTSRQTYDYFSVQGGIDVRGASRIGATASTGLFAGEREEAFIFEIGVMAHSSRAIHPATHDATVSFGFTVLPENSGVHLTVGWNAWATRHQGFRAEAEVIRRIGGNGLLLYVGRVGFIF